MIPHLVAGRSLSFPGQEITWAGTCPWTGGYSFGTERGELFICRNEDEDELDVLPIKVSDEAVNDVAFWRDHVGVSTRSEVIVARRDQSGHDLIRIITAAEGAHGILATPGGRFFAPMGVAGLLVLDPGRIPDERIARERPSQGLINFYRLIYLGDSSRDMMACAARTSGLLMIRSNPKDPLEIVGLASQNMDFIDVCSVASPTWPAAVVGLSLDRSLVFARDLGADEAPQTLRLDELRGTPYAILGADGHLFVLTSKEIVDFPDLVSMYMNGETLDRPFRYRYTLIQAVDAFIAYERDLIVVMDEEVRSFEIPSLLQPLGASNLESGRTIFPAWNESEQSPTRRQPSWDCLSLTS